MIPVLNVPLFLLFNLKNSLSSNPLVSLVGLGSLPTCSVKTRMQSKHQTVQHLNWENDCMNEERGKQNGY